MAKYNKKCKDKDCLGNNPKNSKICADCVKYNDRNSPCTICNTKGTHKQGNFCADAQACSDRVFDTNTKLCTYCGHKKRKEEFFGNMCFECDYLYEYDLQAPKNNQPTLEEVFDFENSKPEAYSWME